MCPGSASFAGEGGLAAAAGGDDCTSFCNKTATSVTSKISEGHSEELTITKLAETNERLFLLQVAKGRRQGILEKVLSDIYRQGDFPPQCRFNCFDDEKRRRMQEARVPSDSCTSREVLTKVS